MNLGRLPGNGHHLVARLQCAHTIQLMLGHDHSVPQTEAFGHRVGGEDFHHGPTAREEFSDHLRPLH